MVARGDFPDNKEPHRTTPRFVFDKPAGYQPGYPRCDGHSAGAGSSLGVLSVNGSASTPNDRPGRMGPRTLGPRTVLTSQNTLAGQGRRIARRPDAPGRGPVV